MAVPSPVFCPENGIAAPIRLSATLVQGRRESSIEPVEWSGAETDRTRAGFRSIPCRVVHGPKDLLIVVLHPYRKQLVAMLAVSYNCKQYESDPHCLLGGMIQRRGGLKWNCISFDPKWCRVLFKTLLISVFRSIRDRLATMTHSHSTDSGNCQMYKSVLINSTTSYAKSSTTIMII